MDWRQTQVRIGAQVWILAAAVPLILLSGCGSTSIPSGCKPVSGFDVGRYLGKWHEIARFDNSFERGLTRCTAEYRLRTDGRVEVINRGYRASNGEWEEAKGVAEFLGDRTVGSLKVSFFGPFWGGYHVLALDPEYRWSLVAGPNRDYLWILARDPSLEPQTLASLEAQAKALGFPMDRLVRVDQSQPPPAPPKPRHEKGSPSDGPNRPGEPEFKI